MGTAQVDILDTCLLPFDGDFSQQVEELLARVRLTRSEVENLQHLLNDLTDTLSYCWPGIQVHPFGSIVTGLGIKTSDIDCYIQLPFDRQRKQDSVIRARNALYRDTSKYTQIFAILTAKVPIVKFVHVPTGFNCDINFSSLNGVRNSKLIAFLLNLDLRALRLAILLKYWSKVYNFTGTNLMPNYALTLMVIFYLQVKSVLPSVAEIQQHIPGYWVDGWNTAFNDDFTYVPDNAQSLYDLLGGFFEYYKSFDYAQLIISPYVGCPVKKEVVKDINKLPAALSLYKDNVLKTKCEAIRLDTAICIQDPFEHSRNCCMAVFPKLFSKIITHIELACSIFDKKISEVFLSELFTMSVPRESQLPRRGDPLSSKSKKKKGKHKGKNRNQFNKEQIRRFCETQWVKHKRFQGYSNSRFFDR